MNYNLLLEHAKHVQKEKTREFTAKQIQAKEELVKRRIELEKRKIQSSMLKQSLSAKARHFCSRPLLQKPAMTSLNPSASLPKENKIQTEIKAKHSRKQTESDKEKRLELKPEVTADPKINKTKLSHKIVSNTNKNTQGASYNSNPRINTQLKNQHKESVKKTNNEEKSNKTDNNREIKQEVNTSHIKQKPKKPPTYEEILKLAMNMKNTNSPANPEINTSILKSKSTHSKESSPKIEQTNEKHTTVNTKNNNEMTKINSLNLSNSTIKPIENSINTNKMADTPASKRQKLTQNEPLINTSITKTKKPKIKEDDTKTELPSPPPQPRPKIQQSAYAQKIFNKRSQSSTINKFNQNPVANKRVLDEREIESEYSDEDGFIVSDDGEPSEDVKLYIRSMFKRPPRDYSSIVGDDSSEAMVSNFSQQQREEKRSARIGLQEDLEDIEKEKQIILKKKKLKKLKRLH